LIEKEKTVVNWIDESQYSACFICK